MTDHKPARKPAARPRAKAAPPSVVAPTEPVRRRPYGDRRISILGEAIKLFNERGFANCSLEDIAERLGLTKTAVYYYFPTKEAILYEGYCRAFDQADTALAAAEQAGHNGRARLEFYVRAYLINGIADGGHVLPLRDQKSLSPALREELDRRRHARRDRLRDLVAAGITDGSIRPCNPKVVVSAWAGTISWILESYDPAGELSFEEVAEETVRLLLHGLAA